VQETESPRILKQFAQLSRITDVATSSPPSKRHEIEAQVLEITRELLREMGNTGEVENVRAAADLDRDLGLESVERAELLARLDRAFGLNLQESAISEARTLDDVITAMLGAGASVMAEPNANVSTEQQAALVPGSAAIGANGSSAHAGVEDTFGKDSPEFGVLRRVAERIWGLYAAAVFLLWLVVTWLIVLMMPPGEPAARMTTSALRTYFKMIGLPITLEGRENLHASGPAIYVSNHTSYADVLVVMALFDTSYHFVAKSEINDMPFIGTFLRKIGHFSFDRTKIRARSRQAEQMEKALARGESIFVFAEGTFTARTGMGPFHLGGFRASVKTGRPIVPVALRGIRRLLRDGTYIPRWSPVTVTVSPAIFPILDGPTLDGGNEWSAVLRLRDEARRIISSHSGEPMLQMSLRELPDIHPQ
jgi:1-acyl-sn-glycerol-3-phosphate acyltransferase